MSGDNYREKTVVCRSCRMSWTLGTISTGKVLLIEMCPYCSKTNKVKFNMPL